MARLFVRWFRPRVTQPFSAMRLRSGSLSKFLTWTLQASLPRSCTDHVRWTSRRLQAGWGAVERERKDELTRRLSATFSLNQRQNTLLQCLRSPTTHPISSSCSVVSTMYASMQDKRSTRVWPDLAGRKVAGQLGYLHERICLADDRENNLSEVHRSPWVTVPPINRPLEVEQHSTVGDAFNTSTQFRKWLATQSMSKSMHLSRRSCDHETR
jgi:hypothetical protein